MVSPPAQEVFAALQSADLSLKLRVFPSASLYWSRTGKYFRKGSLENSWLLQCWPIGISHVFLTSTSSDFGEPAHLMKQRPSARLCWFVISTGGNRRLFSAIQSKFLFAFFYDFQFVKWWSIIAPFAKSGHHVHIFIMHLSICYSCSRSYSGLGWFSSLARRVRSFNSTFQHEYPCLLKHCFLFWHTL